MLSEPNISYKPFWGICRPLNSWRANSPNPIQIYCAEKIEEALTNMGEAIHKNIRKVDVCTRYSAMQYLIILSQPTEAEIPNIMTRIFMQYYKLQDSQNFTPTYEYITMKD